MIFVLDRNVLVSHLRMEGKYYVQPQNEPYDVKHTHAIFTFKNGIQLRYHDTRKFGRFYLYERGVDLKAQKAFQHCGLDVFDESLTPQYLYEQLHLRRITLKQALLDQSVMESVISMPMKFVFRSAMTRKSVSKGCEKKTIPSFWHRQDELWAVR